MMNTHSKKHKIVLGLIIAFIIVGCSLTTFQSPRTLQPGKAVLGVGVGGLFNLVTNDNPFRPIELDLYTRFGLFRNLDAGLKFSSWFTLSGDVKYQILGDPLFLSVSFGDSYFPRTNLGWANGDVSEFYGLNSALLFGRENLYAGLKYIYLVTKSTHMSGATETDTDKLPGFMIGASTPGRFRLIPEVNVYRYLSSVDEEPYWLIVGGLGLQYQF